MGFVNSFFSYLLVVIVFLIVAGAAVFFGIFMRKRKDMQTAAGESDGNGKETQ